MGRRMRAVGLGAALGAVAVLAAACGAGAPAAGPSAAATGAATSPSATASRTASSAPAVPVADPVHAVPAPGPRSGELHSADILVRSKTTLTDAQIKAIAAVPKVTGTEVLSIGEASIEDQLLNVVAVDPGTYRNYTPLRSADATVVWDRVAGGELAVNPALRKRLPPDASGFWRMGSAADAPRIHVGAWADQVPGLVSPG